MSSAWGLFNTPPDRNSSSGRVPPGRNPNPTRANTGHAHNTRHGHGNSAFASSRATAVAGGVTATAGPHAAAYPTQPYYQMQWGGGAAADMDSQSEPLPTSSYVVDVLPGDAPRDYQRDFSCITFNPLTARIPLINQTFVNALAILGALVFSVLLYGSLCEILLPAGETPWTLYYGWILSAYMVVATVVCMVAASAPRPGGFYTESIETLSLNYYDGAMDLRVAFSFTVAYVIISIFSIIWYVTKGHASFPMDPTLDVQQYIIFQIVNLSFAIVSLLYSGTAFSSNLNKGAMAVPVRRELRPRV